ncbi:uncharacterized protein PGTG_21614 [Puccinia graminis f. sp. tritici CRL 75-36-700-3]|uniref:Uncharacterized protein n=1 Tax=Puccinia graminis f. sp. tritici (strain CRL 75-36-700-3 / race SCCL) TaxID=418459 RepID=H6QS17_PUCGT|nr:uncharacterized protein PGTG_21614 [Puccinia graminis f. sp. tritici CRL 75-36-700-3]EHS63488.1 hypothetical protein PGTG_21614 [Puccinia graminis f. sp. tritici CRL 75-36-700-3]
MVINSLRTTTRRPKDSTQKQSPNTSISVPLLNPVTIPKETPHADPPRESQQSEPTIPLPPSAYGSESSLEYLDPDTLVSPEITSKPVSVSELSPNLGPPNQSPPETDSAATFLKTPAMPLDAPNLQGCLVVIPPVAAVPDLTLEYLQQETHQRNWAPGSLGQLQQYSGHSILPTPIATSPGTSANPDNLLHSIIVRKARTRLVICDSDEEEGADQISPVNVHPTVDTPAVGPTSERTSRADVPSLPVDPILGTPAGNYDPNKRVWRDPHSKITKAELHAIFEEFKVPYKAAKKKGALIEKYKALIASEMAKHQEGLVDISTSATSANDSTGEESRLPPKSQETPAPAGGTNFNPARQDWPEPDGKITTKKKQQIRDILTDHGVTHLACDSTLVLLAKYKTIVIDSDKPRYNLRPERPLLTQTIVNTANQDNHPPTSKDQETAESNDPVLPDKAHLTNGAPNSVNPAPSPPESPPPSVHQTDTDADFPVGNKSPIITDLDAFSECRGSRSQSPTPNNQMTQRAAVPSPATSILVEPPNLDPMPQVANWVSDVHNASNDLDQDIDMHHEIPVTQQTPAPQSHSMEMLVSTLNIVAQNSVEIGNASIRTMNAIAQGLIGLSSAVESLRTAPAPTPPMWYTLRVAIWPI